MKDKSNAKRMQHRDAGFSLVELLVVIAIIATLAGLIMSAVGGAKVKAKKMASKTEMNNLKLGIIRYEGEYSVYPIGKDNINSPGDTTLLSGMIPAIQGLGYIGKDLNNSVVIDILRNVPKIHANPAYDLNPRRAEFFSAKIANEYKGGPKAPGIDGATGVLNDPWGNPYIITIDTDYNGVANDPVYNLKGLIREPVMVWSLGPDGKAMAPKDENDNVDLYKENKDNVLSWK